MTREKVPSRVAQISKQTNSERVHLGRLAEEYDGIGQYVLVNLAESANTSAYKARVASGDFGTGQTIPAGTKITILSYRGRLEIVSLGAK